VDTLEELFNAGMLLVHQPVPQGRRVAIVTNAGGPGILAADACEAQGLEVAQLSDHTQAQLRAFLPPEASVKNPVDMIASASPAAYEAAIRVLLDDPGIDSLIAIFVPPIITRAQEVAEAIKAGAAHSPKTVLVNFLGSHGVPESLRSLQEASFPSYAFPEAAAMALARATRYGEWLARPEGVEPSFPVDTARARRALGSTPGERWLSYDAVSEIMAAYGIPMARARVARSADEAALLARELGFPVAVKLISDTLTHKTEVGGVRLNLRGPQEVWDAYAGIARKLELSNLAHHMDGVLVQEMIPDGVEVIVGSALDPAFGPLILFGLGGIHVELLKDVAVRVHPLRDVDADEMLAQLKGSPLLDGWRGAPPADKQALRDLLLRVSQLLGDLPEIVELDINPLKVLPPPLGATAVDARIRIHL
jgi:acyl-CoA synthetase (NDP forming)